jgi:hypothetical protein
LNIIPDGGFQSGFVDSAQGKEKFGSDTLDFTRHDLSLSSINESGTRDALRLRLPSKRKGIHGCSRQGVERLV